MRREQEGKYDSPLHAPLDNRGALREYRLARSLGMLVYRYVAEEIRPMPAPALQVYDALAEGAIHAAN